MRSKLSRRLRKKYHRGEYQQFGFTLLCKIKPISDSDKYIDLMFKITDMLEKEDLVCAGSGKENSICFYISSKGIKNNVDQQKIEKVIEIIRTIEEIEKFEYTGLSDCWNPTQKDFDELDKWEIETRKKLEVE